MWEPEGTEESWQRKPSKQDASEARSTHQMADYTDTDSHPLIPPYTVLLKDGETTATIYPIHSLHQMPPGLLEFLTDEFNMEIDRGDTFPFFENLTVGDFKGYWFSSFSAVMVLGNEPSLDTQRQWEKECLGSFFIKAKYPGRSSHICTGAFLVNAGIRGKGIGRTLVECYLDWAPRLGYTTTVFDLVFETNVGIRCILEALNFRRAGRLKAAGILKEHDTAVDAIIYSKELVHKHDIGNSGSHRFDKIKYYLETGRYPPMADRQAKSRLRSSAAHYRLTDGKLTLKGREVISDPIKQLQLCTDFHVINHGGINKTTSLITARYYWIGIKSTVAEAIRNCADCRDPSKALAKRQKKDSSPLGMEPHHEHAMSEELSSLSAGLLDSVQLQQHQHQQVQQQVQQQSYRTDYLTPQIPEMSVHSRHDEQTSDDDDEDDVEFEEDEDDDDDNEDEAEEVEEEDADDADNSNIDPDVSAFDQQVQSGEMEIARALIQANEHAHPANQHSYL